MGKKSFTIGVVSYGAGNIGSLIPVLRGLGHKTLLVSQAQEFGGCDMLLLPGVGSAKKALDQLNGTEAKAGLLAMHKRGKPIIGVCLGAQILFENLQEASKGGLGILAGTVEEIRPAGYVNTGWRALDWGALKTMGIATGLRETDQYYFNHEYAMAPPSDSSLNIAFDRDLEIPSIVQDKNVWAIQFHPEKSQHQGGILLRNVLEIANAK